METIKEPDSPQTQAGRFPHNDIVSLLDVNRRYNLAESTAQDLFVGDVLDLVGLDTVRNIRLGYGSSQGLPLLRQEIARLSDIDPDCVLTTQGSVLSLYLLAIELCRPGDEVVLASPWFPPTYNALLGAGIRVKPVPLDFDEGFAISIDDIRAQLSPQTRLVSLASPQNPSGVVTPISAIKDLIAQVMKVCPDAFIFIDETYRFATFGNDPVEASAACLHPRVITSASVTKAFGAPGLRTGWLTTHHSALMQRLITAKMNIVISGSPLDETLAAHVLAQKETVLAPRKRLLKAAIDQVSAWMAREADRLEWVRPDAGALCCVRLRTYRFDATAIKRFWDCQAGINLQLAAGTWFNQAPHYFRLGFGYLDLETLPHALDAVSRALDLAEAQ